MLHVTFSPFDYPNTYPYCGGKNTKTTFHSNSSINEQQMFINGIFFSLQMD